MAQHARAKHIQKCVAVLFACMLNQCRLFLRTRFHPTVSMLCEETEYIITFNLHNIQVIRWSSKNQPHCYHGGLRQCTQTPQGAKGCAGKKYYNHSVHRNQIDIEWGNTTPRCIRVTLLHRINNCNILRTQIGSTGEPCALIVLYQYFTNIFTVV